MQEVQSPVTNQGSDRSILLYTVIVVVLALAIRFFVAAPYLVSGPSMEPTFENNDYLIVDRISYGLCAPATLGSECLDFENPQRGDIVIFTLPQNPGDTLIKRVIGVPGDTVAIVGNTVTITDAADPKGFTLAEPYLSAEDLGGPSHVNVTLGADDYFVLGDNRKVSYDSRLWGVLPRQDIIGRVLVRLYPFNDIGFLPGEARYTHS